MIDFIIKYWIEILLTSITSGIIYMFKQYLGLKNGMKALIRNEIIRIYDKQTELGYCPSYMKENIKENTCDILMPYTETLIYIMFDKEYNFNTLPKGFKKDKNTIEMFINYYDEDKRKTWNNIDKEIKEANKILYEWACKLPGLKNKE